MIYFPVEAPKEKWLMDDHNFHDIFCHIPDKC